MIQIPHKVGYNRSASEMNAGLQLCVIFRGSGSGLLRNPIFFMIFRGGGCPEPLSPLDPPIVIHQSMRLILEKATTTKLAFVSPVHKVMMAPSSSVSSSALSDFWLLINNFRRDASILSNVYRRVKNC